MFSVWLNLFLTFWKIGTFAFGGGLAVLQLIEKEVVQQSGWLTSAQFVELVSISEMTPGPIAVNAATYVGTRLAGLPGAIIATLGVVMTSLILMTLLGGLFLRIKDHPLTRAFFAGLRPVVAGLVACAALTMASASVTSGTTAVLAMLGFFAVFKFKVNPIWLILAAGAIGVAFF